MDRTRNPRLKNGIEPLEFTAYRRPYRRCRCGECPPCLENARWERIFEEKFADPNYYAPRDVQRGSSLNFRP
jgi:hypothetical protein